MEAWELCNKGAALAALGQDEQALGCYDEALSLTPQFANAWNNKGVSLKRAGRVTEALDCFDEAIRIFDMVPVLTSALLRQFGVVPLDEREFEVVQMLGQ